LSTLAGNTLAAAEGSLLQDLGFDAVIPALFLALLWPRLRAPGLRRASVAGAVIALATTPFVPVGVPLMAATAGALAAIPGPTLRRVRRDTS
jgi:predicted branched-subunit amino acid permease